MKQWEVDKVNALYKQMDELQKKNEQLAQSMCNSDHDKRLSSIEAKLDVLIKKCDCSESDDS